MLHFSLECLELIRILWRATQLSYFCYFSGDWKCQYFPRWLGWSSFWEEFRMLEVTTLETRKTGAQNNAKYIHTLAN